MSTPVVCCAACAQGVRLSVKREFVKRLDGMRMECSQRRASTLKDVAGELKARHDIGAYSIDTVQVLPTSAANIKSSAVVASE